LLTEVKGHKNWTCFWLEAMNPPTQALSNANITVLVLSTGASKGKSSFGFLMACSDRNTKLRERQKECSRDLLTQIEQLTTGKNEADLRAWSQISAAEPSADAVSKNLEKIKATVVRRLTATGRSGAKAPGIEMEFAEPLSFVLVSSSAYAGNDDGPNPDRGDLSALDLFEPEAGAALLEAQKLNGLLRQRWYLAIVKAMRKVDDGEEKPKKDGPQPFKTLPLGVGFATDAKIAKARALRAAEIRADVVSEAMFLRPQKAAETKPA